MTEIDKYVFFYGNDWLSNFAPAKIKIKDPFYTNNLFNEGDSCIIFNDSETYYQSWKARIMNDKNNFYKIVKSSSPGESKKLARNINLNVKDWDSCKDTIMYSVLYKKFTQNPNLLEMLMDKKYDDKTFVEASPVDKYWGIGFNEDQAIHYKELYGITPMDDPKVELGKNTLGKLLNELRKTLFLAKKQEG